MATAYVYQCVECEGYIEKRGSRSAPISVTVTGTKKEWRSSLATSTTALVWDAAVSGEPITDFDICWIKSDQNLLVEFTIDSNATYGTNIHTVQILADEPRVIVRDDMVANATANFATGTTDLCDRIRVRNTSGSTAIVDILLLT